MVSLNPLSAIDVCVIISRIGSELEQWPFKGPFPFPSSVLHVVHIRQLAIKLHIFISILFQALSPAYNYDNLACAIMGVTYCPSFSKNFITFLLLFHIFFRFPFSMTIFLVITSYCEKCKMYQNGVNRNLLPYIMLFLVVMARKQGYVCLLQRYTTM